MTQTLTQPYKHLMPVTERPAEVFVRGEGAWLWDAAGTRYLDWLQGWAVNALGHCPPVITQALQAQSTRLLTPSPAVYNLPSIELAARLCELSGFSQVFFGSTGAEANEGAIKLARKWGRVQRAGAHEIITFENGFHGRNLATMAASGKAGWDLLFPPQMPGFAKARLNDLESVVSAINERTVAIMLEPVQGEAGVRPATPAFLQALRQLCDQRGLLLIFDEVQTGCGRLGELFAFQKYGVAPDILTLGKGLGGGVPISAVLAQALPQGPAAAESAKPPATGRVEAALQSSHFGPELAASVSLLAVDGVQQAELQLNPAEMGPVAVQIVVDGAQAQVSFHAVQAETRQALEQSLPDLAAALQGQGLTLAGGGVFQQAPRDTQGGNDRGGNRDSGSRVAGISGGRDSGAAAAPVTVTRRANGLLDTFA